MLNPFDLRTVFLARHAQHVVLVHFPIALFMTGVALDLLSPKGRNANLANAAYLNITIAAVTVFPAAITGVLAWQFIFQGKKLKGMLLFHTIAASIGVVLVLASWAAHRFSRNAGAPALTRLRILVEVLGVAAIALAAHLGGFLSGVNS